MKFFTMINSIWDKFNWFKINVSYINNKINNILFKILNYKINYYNKLKNYKKYHHNLCKNYNR